MLLVLQHANVFNATFPSVSVRNLLRETKKTRFREVKSVHIYLYFPKYSSHVGSIINREMWKMMRRDVALRKLFNKTEWTKSTVELCVLSKITEPLRLEL